jgi:hypothetical protein
MPRMPSGLNPDELVHGSARAIRRLRFCAGDPASGELAPSTSRSHSSVSAHLNGRRLAPPKWLAPFVVACIGSVVVGCIGSVTKWIKRQETAREQRDCLRVTEAGLADSTETAWIRHPVDEFRHKLTNADRQPSRPGTASMRQRTLGERVKVALIPAAQRDLRRLQELTKLSKTDLANRAITTYEFLDAHLRAGHELVIRDKRTGEIRRVEFL